MCRYNKLSLISGLARWLRGQKALATKHNGLSLIPWSHMVEGKKLPLCFIL